MKNSKYTILDGGMGQELYQRGIRGEQSIWSTNGLIKAPDVVRDIHIEFIEAGADVITTNTYCTGPHCLAQVNMEDRYAELTDLACDLALQARTKTDTDNKVKIAGSLPPLYGTYLPDIERDLKKMQDEYAQMIEVMVDKVDLFLCESMTTPEEAYAAASMAAQAGIPVWVAWTLADNTRALLRTGDTIETAYKALNDIDNIEAYLFNCSIPEAMLPALKQLKPLTDKPIGAYANGFAPIPAKRDRGDIEIIGKRHFNAEEYGAFVQEWITQDATILGGCCEIGPAHIQYLTDMIEN